MERSFLIENLKQLSQKQWATFVLFLKSPYFNQREDVLKLGLYLEGCSKDWSMAKLDRYYLFGLFFEEHMFKHQLLKDLFSKFQKQLRLFLAYDAFRHKVDLQQATLIEACLDNNMLKLWQQQKKQFEQKQQANEENAFIYNRLLEIEKKQGLQLGSRKEVREILELQISHLDRAYWKKRIRLAVEHISLGKVLNTGLYQDQAYIIDQLPKGIQSFRSVELYLTIYKMLYHDEVSSVVYFEQLLAYLAENYFPACDEDEIYSFYIYGINYCTANINRGNTAYYASLFRIYELLEVHERLVQNNQLSQWTFLNVVATACNLKKYSWAEAFIDKMHSYIPAKHRKNALHYNVSLLNFYKQAYDEALVSLQKVYFTDPYYALNARILELRIFYEKGEWLVLDAYFERFRIYLFRDKTLPKERKENSRIFLKCLRELSHFAHLQTANSVEQLGEFRDKLAKQKPLMHRSWLLKKVEGLLLRWNA